MAFKEPKAVRLPFHDCMPYVDGTGGCDFKEYEDTTNMLRPTIAILVDILNIVFQEKLYLEAGFPEAATVLESSPKDLGMSRADLWSFAGLVAFDKVRKHPENFALQCNSTSFAMIRTRHVLQSFLSKQSNCSKMDGRSAYRAQKPRLSRDTWLPRKKLTRIKMGMGQ